MNRQAPDRCYAAWRAFMVGLNIGSFFPYQFSLNPVSLATGGFAFLVASYQVYRVQLSYHILNNGHTLLPTSEEGGSQRLRDPSICYRRCEQSEAVAYLAMIGFSRLVMPLFVLGVPNGLYVSLVPALFGILGNYVNAFAYHQALKRESQQLKAVVHGRLFGCGLAFSRVVDPFFNALLRLVLIACIALNFSRPGDAVFYLPVQFVPWRIALAGVCSLVSAGTMFLFRKHYDWGLRYQQAVRLFNIEPVNPECSEKAKFTCFDSQHGALVGKGSLMGVSLLADMMVTGVAFGHFAARVSLQGTLMRWGAFALGGLITLVGNGMASYRRAGAVFH